MTGVAIVTGASRGIGAAVARLSGANGYRICVNYRSGRDAAAGVAADIVSAGGEALAVQADVANRNAVRRLVETVDQRLGRLTALVNNAGIHGPGGRVEALELDALEEVLAINAVGLVACSQQTPAEKKAEAGDASA